MYCTLFAVVLDVFSIFINAAYFTNINKGYQYQQKKLWRNWQRKIVMSNTELYAIPVQLIRQYSLKKCMDNTFKDTILGGTVGREGQNVFS